jgi:hypothetical protein
MRSALLWHLIITYMRTEPFPREKNIHIYNNKFMAGNNLISNNINATAVCKPSALCSPVS